MTSGGFLGLDPELVGQMATRFDSEAQNIQNLISQMNSVVSSNIPANWKGTDAQQFQGEWESTLVPQLRNVEQALRLASTTARRNIQAQQSTSSQV
ncbi:WXG100 family type VII secretion target [Dietzia sp. SLG510A3-30A2]|jgi:WXG100 family type VII secretion target|nr:WXG100 family type VII secretion target [Dietzia sp. SLG510A3-30A2]